MADGYFGPLVTGQILLDGIETIQGDKQGPAEIAGNIAGARVGISMLGGIFDASGKTPCEKNAATANLSAEIQAILCK